MRVASGRRKVNIQTIARSDTPNREAAPPRWILIVGAGGTGELLLLEASISCTSHLSAVEAPPVSNAAAVQFCCLVVACCSGETEQVLSRDPSINARPSMINAR